MANSNCGETATRFVCFQDYSPCIESCRRQWRVRNHHLGVAFDVYSQLCGLWAKMAVHCQTLAASCSNPHGLSRLVSPHFIRQAGKQASTRGPTTNQEVGCVGTAKWGYLPGWGVVFLLFFHTSAHITHHRHTDTDTTHTTHTHTHTAQTPHVTALVLRDHNAVEPSAKL